MMGHDDRRKLQGSNDELVEDCSISFAQSTLPLYMLARSAVKSMQRGSEWNWDRHTLRTVDSVLGGASLSFIGVFFVHVRCGTEGE